MTTSAWRLLARVTIPAFLPLPRASLFPAILLPPLFLFAALRFTSSSACQRLLAREKVFQHACVWRLVLWILARPGVARRQTSSQTFKKKAALLEAWYL